jgi:hypothetical protein
VTVCSVERQDKKVCGVARTFFFWLSTILFKISKSFLWLSKGVYTPFDWNKNHFKYKSPACMCYTWHICVSSPAFETGNSRELNSLHNLFSQIHTLWGGACLFPNNNRSLIFWIIKLMVSPWSHFYSCSQYVKFVQHVCTEIYVWNVDHIRTFNKSYVFV